MNSTNSKKLSDAVKLTKAIVHDDGLAYNHAAVKALQSMGFSKPRETSVRAALIVNDIGADEKDSLLRAVTQRCARDGWDKGRWAHPPRLRRLKKKLQPASEASKPVTQTRREDQLGLDLAF